MGRGALCSIDPSMAKKGGGKIKGRRGQLFVGRKRAPLLGSLVGFTAHSCPVRCGSALLAHKEGKTFFIRNLPCAGGASGYKGEGPAPHMHPCPSGALWIRMLWAWLVVCSRSRTLQLARGTWQ